MVPVVWIGAASQIPSQLISFVTVRGGAFMSRIIWILSLAAALVMPLVGCVHVNVPLLHIP